MERFLEKLVDIVQTEAEADFNERIEGGMYREEAIAYTLHDYREVTEQVSLRVIAFIRQLGG